MMEKEINATMDFDKEPMLSNHQTVSHSPEIFTLDFKSIYPQFTPDNKPILKVSHKVVLLDPYVAKSFLEVLAVNINNYEKNFGKIKVPSAVKKAQKQMKEAHVVSAPERPLYMG